MKHFTFCIDCGGDYLECFCKKTKVSDKVGYLPSQRTRVDHVLRNEYISLMLSKLHERERNVIKYYYGIDNPTNLNFTEIGKIFGVTGCRVSQIHNKALRKLKCYAAKDKNFRELFFDRDIIEEQDRAKAIEDAKQKVIAEEKALQWKVQREKDIFERRKAARQNYIEKHRTFIRFPPLVESKQEIEVPKTVSVSAVEEKPSLPQPKRFIPFPPAKIKLQKMDGVFVLYDAEFGDYLEPSLDQEIYYGWIRCLSEYHMRYNIPIIDRPYISNDLVPKIPPPYIYLTIRNDTYELASDPHGFPLDRKQNPEYYDAYLKYFLEKERDRQVSMYKGEAVPCFS